MASDSANPGAPPRGQPRNNSPPCDRGQQRDFVPVPHAGVQLRVPQVHGSERALGNVAGPGKLLPHAAHDVADRGRERYRHGGFRAADELRVAGEKADANRAGRLGRHSDPEDSRPQPPVEPVVTACQILACFALAPEAGASVNVVVLRSRTAVSSVTVWPPRRTVIVSAAPPSPRNRCRNFVAQPSSTRSPTS